MTWMGGSGRPQRTLPEGGRMKEQESLCFLDWWDEVGVKFPWMRLLGRAEKEACRQTAQIAWAKAKESK